MKIFLGLLVSSSAGIFWIDVITSISKSKKSYQCWSPFKVSYDINTWLHGTINKKEVLFGPRFILSTIVTCQYGSQC